METPVRATDNLPMTLPPSTQSALRDAMLRVAHLRLALVFGSFARGKARADSDIDLAVLANRALESDEKIRLIESIAQVTGRAVDLVDLATAGHPLLGEVLRDGYRILGSADELADLATRAALDANDFLPLARRMLKQRRLAWTA